MTEVFLTVDGKSAMKAFNVNGRYLPLTTTIARWETLKNLECHPDDVFICGYPMAGSSWIQKIVLMLLKNSPDPIQSENSEGYVNNPDVSLDGLAKLPRPRVFVSHLHFTDLPRQARELRCKVIVMERDVKDVAALYYTAAGMSLYTGIFFDGLWSSFAKMFLRGKVIFNSWFDHTKSYRRVPRDHPGYPIIGVNYEDMLQNTIGTIRLLAKFLGVPEDLSLIKIMASMLSSIISTSDSRKRTLEDRCGHNVIIRPGDMGEWKKWFTVAESELFDAEYERQLGQIYHPRA